MSIRLTISIPTYNRSKDLSMALQSIVGQVDVEIDPSEIEVLVSDNASTDATMEVLDQWRTALPWQMRVHRNPVNIGLSGNMQTIFEIARGDYIFILSDDDALENTCIREVIKALDGNPAMVVVNASVWDSRLTTILAESMYPQFLESKSFLRGGEEVFWNTGWLAMPLISGQVFRRDSWLECPPTEGMDSICLHIFRAFRILSSESLRIIPMPLVRYRTENAEGRWNRTKGYPFIFHFDVIEAWTYCRDLYQREFYREIYFRLRSSVLFHLREEKGNGRRIYLPYFIPRLLRSYDLRVVFPIRELGLAVIPSHMYTLYCSLRCKILDSMRPIKKRLKVILKGRGL